MAKTKNANQILLPIDSKDLATAEEIRGLSKRGGDNNVKFPVVNLEFRPGHNARTEYDEERIVEKMESIKAMGLITPINIDILKTGKGLVTAGHYRTLAFQRLFTSGDVRFEYIPAMVNPKSLTELDRLLLMLIENTKVELPPMDEAMKFQEAINLGMTAADVAKKTGNNAMHVHNRLVLANLSQEEKDLIAQKKISVTAAVELAKKNPDNPEERVHAILQGMDSEAGKLQVKEITKKEEPKAPEPPEQEAPETDDDQSADDTGAPGDDVDFSDERADSNFTSDDKVIPEEENAHDRGTSPKSPSPTDDPAVKSKDQPDQNMDNIASGKATIYDLSMKAIGTLKELDKLIGEDEAMGNLSFNLDKVLHEIKACCKK